MSNQESQPMSDVPDLNAQAAHLFSLGNASYCSGRFSEAASYYRQVLQLVPTHQECYNNLGAALADLGQLDQAMACYLRALQLRPNYAEAHFNLGNALRQLRFFTAAESSYRRAVELQPGRPGFHLNWAVCLAQLGRLDEAETVYRHALHLEPAYPEALTSLGLVLAEQSRFQDALACHTESLRLRPDYPEAHRNRSLILLLLGDFRQGWEDYEWRWRCADFQHVRALQSRWDGSATPDKTVLLLSEQGLGDTFQFIRYAALVKQKAARVIVATRRELIPLLRNCEGIDRLVPLDVELPDSDFQCPLMSLPHVLGTTPETIPARIPYLFPDPQRVAFWQDELRSLSGFRVGLCWQGSRGNEYYREHGFPLDGLGALVGLEGVHWISLQKGADSRQLATAPLPIIDITSRLDFDTEAFADTAAVMSLLDLVITFDTAVAHLAGALGKPVWIVLPHPPDWRWQLERQDSPWYPTARLFRQQRRGDWQVPLDEVAAAMKQQLAD
jgi:tetratricopeptide (TPR) repeat protein